MKRNTDDPARQESHYTDLEEVSELAGVNTTPEAVARHCRERLVPSLRDGGLSPLAVRVLGSPDVYAARRDLLD